MATRRKGKTPPIAPPKAVTPCPRAHVDADLLRQIEESRPLTLEDIAITTTHPLRSGETRAIYTGEALARLLSFAEQYTGGVNHATDGDSVNLKLRGLSQLFSAEGHIEDEAAFFIQGALDDCAARLQSSSRIEGFRVGLLVAPHNKAGA